jgi:hypothetical protein
MPLKRSNTSIIHPIRLNLFGFTYGRMHIKMDRTAFSEQLLLNGRTDFLFQQRGKEGYINRMDFKVDGETRFTGRSSSSPGYHKSKIAASLPPQQRIKIETPFHVKLPYNFSRGGYIGDTYQITQWYPKPAV